MIPLVDATDVGRIRRRLYRVGDFPLPVPVAAVQAAAGLGTLLATWLVLGLLGLSFGSRTSVFYLAPALLAGWSMNTDQIEGRSAAAYAGSWVRWAASPREVYG